MTIASPPLPYSDDVETIPPDEADDIQRVVEAMQSVLAQGLAKSGQFRADVHVTTHGYVPGEFRVLPNLPDELAQGLFEREDVYPVVARFSNAASQSQPDAIPERSLTATIRRIHPRAELRDGDNVFVAEADILNEDGILRPGMRGQARVSTERHPLGWNLFHKPVAWTLGWIGL